MKNMVSGVPKPCADYRSKILPRLIIRRFGEIQKKN